MQNVFVANDQPCTVSGQKRRKTKWDPSEHGLENENLVSKSPLCLSCSPNGNEDAVDVRGEQKRGKRKPERSIGQGTENSLCRKRCELPKADDALIRAGLEKCARHAWESAGTDHLERPYPPDPNFQRALYAFYVF